MSSKAVRARVASGVWREPFPGAYIIGGTPTSPCQEIITVLLWVRARAETRSQSCASHTSAAFLHGLGRFHRPIHVVTPRMLRAPSRSVIVHRASLEAADIESVRKIPTTTVARTLLDLGAVWDLDAVESALETALRRGQVLLPRLRWQLERCGRKGTRGAAALRRLLEDRTRGYIPSESELELRLFRLLSRRRLPVPTRQKVIRDPSGRCIARVDYAYPAHHLVVEVHGWKYHGDSSRWNRDLKRGNQLVLHGERVLTFTWMDVTKDADEVASTIMAALRVTNPQRSFQL